MPSPHPTIPSARILRLFRARARVRSRVVNLSYGIVSDLADLGIMASSPAAFLSGPSGAPLAAAIVPTPASSGLGAVMDPAKPARGAASARQYRPRRWFRVPDRVRSSIVRSLVDGCTQAEAARRAKVSVTTVQNIRCESLLPHSLTRRRSRSAAARPVELAAG